MKTQCLIACSLFAALLALSGCDDTYTPKDPHVQMETVSHPVLFTDGVTVPTPAEQDSLAAFVATLHPAAVVYAGLATGDNSPRAVARARFIRNYLVHQGVDKNAIRLQPTQGLDPRTVVLSVQFARGVPPEPCPDWSRNAMTNFENTPDGNFGCAYNNDMILQMANPADYNGGHGTSVVAAPRDSAVIQHYLSNVSQPMASGGTAAASGGGASGSSGGGATSSSSP